MSAMKKSPLDVCVICSGNICRSPYAEAVIRRAVAGQGWEDHVKVRSAGTLQIVGQPAHEMTLNVAAERGLNLIAFRSSALDDTCLAEADLIIALGREHLPWLRKRIPAAPPHVWLITAPGEAEPPEDDPGILDPVGFGDDDYRVALDAIDATISRVIEAIGVLAGLPTR